MSKACGRAPRYSRPARRGHGDADARCLSATGRISAIRHCRRQRAIERGPRGGGETEDGTIGVVVDDLIGQQQVVIKSLETNYRRVDGVAGATILGNGLVALILDVDALKGLSDENTNIAKSSLILESSEVH
ncbi:MAG: chemotaxis protein CheW [Geminicoccaceae bacterium]